jgi:hypothetical protein
LFAGYPNVEGAKFLDGTKEQAEALTGLAVKDAITVEVRDPDTSTTAVQVPVAAFNKWVGKPEVVQNAAHLKGRRPGYSPTGNGNGGYWPNRAPAHTPPIGVGPVTASVSPYRG